MRSLAATLLLAALPAAASPQPLTNPEATLYTDMETVALPAPLVSTPGTAAGVIWSQVVAHRTKVPAVRVHVQVRQGRATPDWGIRIRNLAGSEVEVVRGGSPLLSGGDFWSREVAGRGAEVELFADANPQGLQVAVDQYAFRVSSGFEQSIHGIDQRVAIARAPQPIRGWGGPVARLSFIKGGRQFVCTGFLLTRDLMMTNEHCLSTPPVALSAYAEFGFDAPDADATALRVIRLEAADRGLDYAVVRLEPASGHSWGRVSVAPTAAAERQELAVIQHPAGEHKQASVEGCVASGASLPGLGGGATDFGHECDTLGGSSGSPVFERQNGRLVGLHHLGFLQGGTVVVNRAVHIGLVLDDIRRRLPALHAEITAP